MPTISQAEINRASYQTGQSAEDINKQLTDKGYTNPWTVNEAWITLPWVTNPNVVNTNNYRDKAQENANFVDNRINGGKTVTNTTTSNGKTTKTYSDGTTETTDSGVSDTTGTPDRRQLLDEQKNIYSEQEKLQADVSKRYEELKVSGDTAYNQLVENTKTQFAGLRTQLTDANRRFEMKTSQGQYLNNGFRYTPQSSEGMVYDAEQAGLAKLGDLNLKESTALQMALEAKNENDYNALEKYTNAVRNIQNDRMNTIRAMTEQIKTIEDTDKNIRNMNPNEAKFMQSMIDSYILTAWDMDATKTEEYYKKQSKELSDIMGFNVAPEFIKAQVEWAKASAKLEVNEALTKANWYYTDSLGRPLTNAQGKTIPFEKEDWGTWVEWNMLNVGTYDENGNRVMKTYELKWGEKSYADTLKDLPPTPTNITITALAQAYSWPMSELLVTPENTFIPTTNPAYKNVGNGGMQCAEFVNRVTGTSFASGKAANKQPASSLWIGSIASWSPKGAGEYWHAGIIVGQEGDNWIIKSVNLRWNGIVSIDSIPKSVIEGGYTPEAVKNMPMEVSGVYDPNQDKNLTPIGQNKDGTGVYLDKNTNQTISESEAKAKYGQSINNVAAQFTPEQIAVMSTMTGKPTAGDKVTLKKYGLDEAKLWQYRAEKVANSSAYNNLDTPTKSRIDKYVLDFENEQVVKDFNTMNIAIQTARTLADSGTDDQALIYTFAKVMDPNSVVRESEYDTVQRFSQSLAQGAYGKVDRVFGNDGFMTDSAKQAILKTLEKKLNAQKISYDNIREQTKKQIKGKASTLSEIELDDLLKQYDTTSNTPKTSTQETTDWNWWTTN